MTRRNRPPSAVRPSAHARLHPYATGERTDKDAAHDAASPDAPSGERRREAPHAVRVPTPDEIRRFRATVDVPTAGRCWGLGRDASYRLARTGRFPVPVLELGGRLRVARSSIMKALGIPEAPTP
jgi:hypothetical protein